MPASLGEPLHESPCFSPFKTCSPLRRGQNPVDSKLCPAKPQRELVLGACGPQFLGLRQFLGLISSSPRSRGCFFSGIWDHMARGSSAGPKFDCSERGKPGAGRRSWRRSLAEAGGVLAFSRAKSAAAKSPACLNMKIRQDGLCPRTPPVPGAGAAAGAEGRSLAAAYMGSA